MQTTVEQFLQHVKEAAEKNTLVKLSLGGKRNRESDLKNIFAKPVIIKNGFKLSFVFRHLTKDITKNFDITEAIPHLRNYLQQDFFNADLFTTHCDYQLLQQTGKTRIIEKKPSHNNTPAAQHDKQKQRIIPAGKNYLQLLGITNKEGLVKKDMQDKYKQINRYAEIIDGIIKDVDFGDTISVADMGSGKGYLTFALYDYLTSILHLQATVTGIEMRQDLVNTCSNIAATAAFNNLHFYKGTIADSTVAAVDMLIALHACDTATDDAIYKGISNKAKVIVVAPCCHKQIRRQMKPQNVLSSLTKHGILLERQAEMVTDTIRALLLEALGYKTKVFEFIDTEHTPKNVMIAAVKTNTAPSDEAFEKVKQLKALFNIEQHYLEKLLGV